MTDSNTTTIHLDVDGCSHDSPDECDSEFERQLAAVVRSAIACDVDLEGDWSLRSKGPEYAIEIWEIERD